LSGARYLLLLIFTCGVFLTVGGRA